MPARMNRGVELRTLDRDGPRRLSAGTSVSLPPPVLGSEFLARRLPLWMQGRLCVHEADCRVGVTGRMNMRRRHLGHGRHAEGPAIKNVVSLRHCLDPEAAAEASHGPASDDITYWE